MMWMLLSFRTMVHQLKLQKSKCSLSLLISCVAVMNVLAPALRYTFVLFCIDWFKIYIMWIKPSMHVDSVRWCTMIVLGKTMYYRIVLLVCKGTVQFYQDSPQDLLVQREK